MSISSLALEKVEVCIFQLEVNLADLIQISIGKKGTWLKGSPASDTIHPHFLASECPIVIVTSGLGRRKEHNPPESIHKPSKDIKVCRCQGWAVQTDIPFYLLPSTYDEWPGWAENVLNSLRCQAGPQAWGHRTDELATWIWATARSEYKTRAGETLIIKWVLFPQS